MLDLINKICRRVGMADEADSKSAVAKSTLVCGSPVIKPFGRFIGVVNRSSSFA